MRRRGGVIAKVIVALSMSLDGYIAGPDDGNPLPLGEGGKALFEWHFNGDTPSRHYERFRLSGPSAQVFGETVSSAGAVVTGRRTYDISNGWGGDGPVPGPAGDCAGWWTPRASPASAG